MLLVILAKSNPSVMSRVTTLVPTVTLSESSRYCVAAQRSLYEPAGRPEKL